jgi:hypothetical protein
MTGGRILPGKKNDPARIVSGEAYAELLRRTPMQTARPEEPTGNHEMPRFQTRQRGTDPRDLGGNFLLQLWIVLVEFLVATFAAFHPDRKIPGDAFEADGIVFQFPGKIVSDP